MRKTPLLGLTGLTGLAGLVGFGLISVPTAMTASAAGDDNPAYLKRDDQVADLVLVADDDDDDTGDTNAGTNTGTGQSADTNDNTRSNFTAVSRDRDLSRGDKTRDWTRDGSGIRHRDHSANHTNDRSRNDSRR